MNAQRESRRIFTRIIAQLFGHWEWLACGFVCLLLTSGLGILGPELMKRAIDSGIAYDYAAGEASGSRSLIIWLGVLMLVVSVARGVFGFGRQYLSEMVSQLLAFELRMAMYDRIQRLSFEYHDHAQTGQLMSRATQDIEGIRFFVIMLAMAGFIVVWYAGIWAILFSLDWRLALLSLACMPFVLQRAWHLGKRLEPVWNEVQESLAQMGTVLQENLTGVKVVRAFGREVFEIGKYAERSQQLFDAGVFAGRVQAFNTPLMTFMFSLATAIVMLFGGIAVVGGDMTVGELTQFSSYLAMLVWPVAMLGNVVTMLSRGLASGARIFEVIDAQSKVQEAEDACELGRAEGHVQFEDVAFSYAPADSLHEGAPHLGPLSFECAAGQTVALVGATGSGKSTLVNLLPRFYEVDQGRVTLDGKDVRDVSLASLRRNVGVVQQEVFLFSASIRENIAYGASDASFADIVAAARAAHLHDFIESLPGGYETEVGERGVTLSGGQKQRLAIARTLLVAPSVLILDDSTSSVDAETEYQIQQALKALVKDRTTFVVAHRLRTVMDADLILVLGNGRIVERGSHEELMARGEVYPDLVGHQIVDEPAASSAVASPDSTSDGGTSDNTGVAGLAQEGDLVDEVAADRIYDHSVVYRLLARLLRYKVLLVTTVVSMLLTTATTLAPPWLIGYPIDHPIGNGRVLGLDVAEPSLLLVFLAFVVVGLIGWASQYVNMLATAYLGNTVIYDLRTEMFAHLQTLSMAFYDRHQVGRLMSRVQNDVGAVQEVLAGIAAMLVGDLVAMAAVILILFAMNVELALLTLSIVPVLIGTLYVWQRHGRRIFSRVPQAISVVNASLQENISGAKAVQTLSREEQNLAEFEAVNRANLEANLGAARYSAGMEPIVAVLTGVASALVIIFGGFLVLDGALLPGALIAFSIYVGRFFDPIYRMAWMYTVLQRAMAGGQRVFELLDVEPDLADRENAVGMPTIRGSVQFDHVRYSYVEGTEVLRDIDLSIAAGETIALVGATGAGKSTLANLVNRFYDVSGGSLRIDGVDVRDVTQASLRPQIGVVLQTPFLFSGTVRDNILYGREGAGEEDMLVATRAIGADAIIRRLEAGYDTHVEENGGNLSLGERQLISFARTLLANPRILILDEATASIDTQTEATLQEALRQLLEGRTAIVIAHRLSTIQDADRVIVMERGRITESGSHEELLELGGAYHTLHRLSMA